MSETSSIGREMESADKNTRVQPERPNHMNPQLWEKVTALRRESLRAFTGDGAYFFETLERFSAPQKKQTIEEINAFHSDPKRLGIALANVKRQIAAWLYAFDSKNAPWLASESKDQFVQSAALRYSILRMIYTSDSGVAAVNVYTERVAQQAGYQLDMFRANHVRLRPPLRAFSWRLREYSPSGDYVARVAAEIRPLADPLRAIAFRHAMKTGDRTGYEDGDLFNAYSYLDRERARTAFEPAPELIEKEHEILINNIQRLFDAGRRFSGSQIEQDEFKDRRPALSL
jgi:hypothetical protein